MHAVFEQTPGAIFILDTEFRFEYVNPGYERLSGFTRDELIGKLLPEIFNQTEYTEPREEIVRNMVAGEKWEGEMKTYKKDGSTFWAATVASPFRNNMGIVEGYIIIQQDVSDRKKIELALSESETKYKTLVENSHDGIMIIRDFRIYYANDTICNMLGYNPVTEKNDLIHPDDRHKITAIANRRRNGDTSTIHENLRLITRDGQIKECETTSTMVSYGEDTAAFYTVHDVTDKIRFEQELRRSEEKYRKLTELLPIGVYELDLDGNITYINYAGRKLFNFNEQLSGTTSCMSFFTETDGNFMKENLKLEIERLSKQNFYAEQEEFPIPVEFMAKHADGTGFPVLIYVNYILDDKKVTGFRGIIMDISERKAMENALRESEEKYKTLIENSQDGIFAIDGDQILFANNTFCRMVGYTPQELYSKPAISLLHPEDLERGLTISEKRKRGDTSTVNAIFRFVARDGSVKDADVFSSVIELKGQLISYITVHDLTETRRMQEALSRSEKRFRELTEMLPQAIYELDAENRPTFMNRTGRDMFQLANMTFEDKKAYDFFLPEDTERMRAALAAEYHELLDDKGEITTYVHRPMEYTARRTDGTTFPVMIYGAPIIENNVFIGSRGIIVEISERKAMEQALQESEKRYRTLIQSLQEGLFVIQEGKFVFLNDSIVDIVGYTVEELTGRSFLDVIAPEYKQLVAANHQLRVEGKLSPDSYEVKLIKKDGTTEVPVILSVTVTEYQGKWALLGTAKDITERIKIENELHTAKNELEKLNSQLEKRVKESSKRLTEARTQLINLQKENLQSQYDVLKQQVNPHFLFNSLNVLTSLIKLEPDLAEKFSEQLSKVYRYVLENKDYELVDLNTELNFLDAYIFLLNIRFVGKLVVNMKIADENRNDRIIPLAMQLLIENAIKHNIMSKNNPLIIDIFVDENSWLNVINNLQERPSQIVSTGVGLKNILNRYQLLNLTLPTFEKNENQFIAKIQLVKNVNPKYIE
jgi:PAS domain S-box-containing protein